MSSIRQLLMQDAARLVAVVGLDASGARIEIQALLQHVLGQNRAWLLAHDDETPSEDRQTAYQALLQRRLCGEPLAYILGEREFYGLNFFVTPATLIPRPETELLVESALEHLPQHGCVLDLGTGSGAIALAIAHTRPEVQVTAVDVSSEALVVAEQNAQRLGVRNVEFIHGDWFEPLAEQRFDLIVSNPPYIEDDDPHLQQGGLPHEPLSALAAGTDGLDDIRRIVAQSPLHLRPGGWLLLEHGYDQAAQVRELLRQVGLNEVFSACDLAGIERISGGRRA